MKKLIIIFVGLVLLVGCGNVVTPVDTTSPIITLLGENPVSLYVGDTYVDAGVIAIDDVDGDITSSVIIGGDTIDTGVTGTYIVTYNVSDALGNTADEVTRIVNVGALDVLTPFLGLWITEMPYEINITELRIVKVEENTVVVHYWIYVPEMENEVVAVYDIANEKLVFSQTIVEPGYMEEEIFEFSIFEQMLQVISKTTIFDDGIYTMLYEEVDFFKRF